MAENQPLGISLGSFSRSKAPKQATVKALPLTPTPQTWVFFCDAITDAKAAEYIRNHCTDRTHETRTRLSQIQEEYSGQFVNIDNATIKPYKHNPNWIRVELHGVYKESNGEPYWYLCHKTDFALWGKPCLAGDSCTAFKHAENSVKIKNSSGWQAL